MRNPSTRATLRQIIDHAFFTATVPSSMPATALYAIPDFGSITLACSKTNLEQLRQCTMLCDSISEAGAVEIVPPFSPQAVVRSENAALLWKRSVSKVLQPSTSMPPLLELTSRKATLWRNVLRTKMQYSPSSTLGCLRPYFPFRAAMLRIIQHLTSEVPVARHTIFSRVHAISVNLSDGRFHRPLHAYLLDLSLVPTHSSLLTLHDAHHSKVLLVTALTASKADGYTQLIAAADKTPQFGPRPLRAPRNATLWVLDIKAEAFLAIEVTPLFIVRSRPAIDSPFSMQSRRPRC